MNGLKLSIDDNNEIIIGGNDINARKLLLSEIDNSPALKECLEVSLLKGETPKAIGYTIIYLKEAADDSGYHYEPMTIQEVEDIKATGPTSSKGNLRLYTYAAGLSNNRIVARSVAEWTTDWQLFASERPAAGNDYISLTVPSNYANLTDTFSAYCTPAGYLRNYYKEDEGYTSVVYSFLEFLNYAYRVDRATVEMGCVKNTSAGNRVTCISKYVHTWLSITPSISIDSSGVSFGISPLQSAWQIASSVSLYVD